VPGLIMVGTLRDHGKLRFAVRHARRPAVVADLAGQSFDQLVITLDDPDAAVAALA
jgi:hypothetical protein